jgi:RNA polymerase sigma factor (sigma-70 family)
LLERFVRQRDESAFAALVARHGAMVLRVCRRVLGDAQEAEDAFQAAFLILARKATSLKRPDALPGWLHGVARRVALKARTKSAGRPICDLSHCDALPGAIADPLTQLTARELLAVLDEEVQRLPSAQRSAVVLCCVEGHTQEEAARMLGWTPGSVKGRLERGRCRLHQRLTRRGIILSAALAIAAVSRGVAAAAGLRQRAIRAALLGGESAASELAEHVLKGMFLSKLVGAAAVGVMVAFTVSATLMLLSPGPAAEEPATDSPKQADTPALTPRVNALGDPLPEGALARLGTTRLRHGGHIRYVSFTPDGKRLLTQGSDGMVRLWDTTTGKELRHLADEGEGKLGAAALSPDGKRVAAAVEGPNGCIHIWDLENGTKIGTLRRGNYPILRFSTDGKLLAATYLQWGLELWDVAGLRKVRSWQAHGAHQVSTVAFSGDAQKMLTGSHDGKVRLWDVATGRQLQEFTRLDWTPDSDIFSFQMDALSPDGSLVALIELNESSTPKPGAVEWKAHQPARRDDRQATTATHVSCARSLLLAHGQGTDVHRTDIYRGRQEPADGRT